MKEVLEELLANKAFHVVKKLKALFIRNVGECIVGAITLEDRVDARIGVIETVSVHILPKGRVAKKSLYLSEVLAVKNTRYLALREDCEAFVEPEVLPIAASDIVASPRVSDLMSSDIDLRLVTNDDSWGSKGQKRVFHSSEWERRRKNNDGVVAPNVRSQIGLSGVKKRFQSVELSSDHVHLRRFGNDANTTTKRAVLEVTDNDSHKV